MTNETEKSDFSSRLEYLIGQHKEPKKAFAKKCGIKEKQLYVYLRGESEPGLKALRAIKENYPEININWLISGDGNPYLTDDSRPQTETNTLDIQHDRIIGQFDDKEFALEISQALMAVEKTSLKEFYKLGGYIKALSESGTEMRTEPNRSQSQQYDPDVWDGTERRSGEDRRKSVSEEQPPARKNDAPTS